jgi:hypothetical protein
MSRLGSQNGAVAGPAREATSETTQSWDRYKRWNAAVEAEFFDGRWAGRPVYLDMDDEVVARIADLAGETGAPHEVFKEMLRPTLFLPGERGHLLDLHVRRLRRWQLAPQEESPPCLAILAFFSWSAEGMRGDDDFRANNYYARLCQRLGLDPKRGRAACKRVETDFRRDSLELWNGLNSWLEDYEGVLGTPSAHSFDWRSFIGVPISQALLREDERLALRDLFLEYRLHPNQELATSDMLRLLKEWMPSADVSPTLRRLFEHTDAQGRIADIACIELRAWTGDPPPGREARDRPDPSTALLLGAQLRRAIRAELVLSLMVRGSSPAPPGDYRLEEDAPEPAVEALAGPGGLVRVVGSPGDGWRRIEASGQISFPDLLLATVRLASSQGSTLMRKPRRLVILERDEEFHMSVEVDRCELGRENMILAHRSLADAIDQALSGATREGLRRWAPSELAGLPDQWLLWSGVELIEIPEVPDDQPDLSVLIPLEWTKVAVGGGFSLPGHDTWLRGSPPEIRLTALIDKPVTASLARTMSLLSEGPIEGELATFEGAAIVALDGTDLLDGDYKVALREAGPRGKPLISNSFRIRSADFPRPRADLQGMLGSRPSPGRPDGALTAGLIEVPQASFVAGAAVEGGAELERPPRGLSAPSTLRAVPPLELETEVEALDAVVTAHSGSAPSCLMGGKHHYELEPAGRDTMLRRTRPAKIDARCVSCGFEKWFPPRLRGTRRRGQAPTRVELLRPTEPRRIRHDVAAIADGPRGDFNLLLDGLTYARNGSWQLFERLAEQVSDAPWFALEAARTLTGLGHIELVIDLKSGRPALWSIAPATLAIMGLGDAVACGARSERLVSRLAADAEALGGTLRTEQSADAPATIRILSLEQDDLHAVAASASAATGIDVRVSVDPAAAILARLPTLGMVESALPALDWPPVAMERFDLSANKWQRTAAIDAGGAYKFLTRPLRYGFVARPDGGGSVIAADNRLAKWLAAAAEGVTLLAYDEATCSLLTRLGAQLPGLYERVAVLCSGRPPVKRVDGTVTYEEVTPEIASGLYARLSSRGASR